MDSTLAVNTLEAGYPCKVLEFIHFGRVHDKGLGMIFFSKGTCNRGTQNGGMDDGRSIRYIIKERFIDGKDAAFRRSAAPTPTGKSIHIGQGLPAFFTLSRIISRR